MVVLNNNFSGSIVLYNNDDALIKRAVDSFLNATLNGILYLVDNSPQDNLKKLAESNRVIYIHRSENPGFGAAHNTAIKLSEEAGCKYHFIINPDIYFSGDVLTNMAQYMARHSEIGMMMPEILNDNGTLQYLPKLLPSPVWIMRRKIKKANRNFESFIKKYELRDVPEKLIYNSPILSGCFTLLNMRAIQEVGGYDDRFFMYFEDFDLSRRMHQKYKTLYYPLVSVYHGYEGGANKSLKLFKIFIESAIKYYNKWGWFIDLERKDINKKALNQFKDL